MDKIISFFERLYNSILYNGLYIFLSFLFPFIIYKLEAGHEIIENIIDNASGKVGLNISLITFSFFLLAFSVWCVPTVAIYIWKFFTGNKSSNAALYKYMTVIYSGKGHVRNNICENEKITPHLQIPMKYFAIMPWMVFIFKTVQIFSLTAATIAGMIFFIGTIIFIDTKINTIKKLYSRWLFKDDNKSPEGKLKLRYGIFLSFYLLFTAIPFILDLLHLKVFENHAVAATILILFNFWQLVAFYIFISYLEKTAEKIDSGKRFRISHFSYIFVLICSFISIAAFYITNQMGIISFFNPISVAVICIAVMIMFFDIFFTAQLLLTHIAKVVRPACERLTKKDCPAHEGCELHGSSDIKLLSYKLIVTLCIGLYVYFTFFHSLNRHEIRQVDRTLNFASTDERMSLDSYFAKWLDEIPKKTVHEDSIAPPQNIFLISGPGGGSRAAAWFYLGMKELDSIYGDDFYDHVFSISTVSGSSSGANMYLAEKFLGLHDQKTVRIQNYSYHNDFFRKYFWKSSVSGIDHPFNDWLEAKYLKPDPGPSSLQLAKRIYSENYFSSAFFGLLIGDGLEGMTGSDEKHNRNYYFQKEEMNAFIKAHCLGGREAEKARFYFESDLRYPYRGSTRPLFLINTTIIDFGKRGIFSPVSLKGKTLGVDLYEVYANQCCTRKRGLPTVTCVNQSQAFPLINSYDYLDSIGRLCDGGLYDNSGCSTTLEVYQALRRYIKGNGLTNIKIVCINIINGDINNEFTPEYTNSSILNTVTGIASLPFSGNESYAFENLRRQVENHNFTCKSDDESQCTYDEVITIKPKSSYNLTRMLSRGAINGISKDVKSQIEIKNKELDKIIKAKPAGKAEKAKANTVVAKKVKK